MPLRCLLPSRCRPILHAAPVRRFFAASGAASQSGQRFALRLQKGRAGAIHAVIVLIAALHLQC
jgi:hypothetical protein